MKDHRTPKQEAAFTAHELSKAGIKAHLCRLIFSGHYFASSDENLATREAGSYEIVKTYTPTFSTGFFNAEDWSGEEINVAYTVSDDGVIRFEMYDSRFEISPLETDGREEELGGGNGWRTLDGDDWSDPLTTLFFLDADGDDHKKAVIKAARYVRNFV